MQPALISFRLEGLYSKGRGTVKGVPACASEPLLHASWALPPGPCFIFTAEGPAAIAAELYEPPKTPSQNRRGNWCNEEHYYCSNNIIILITSGLLLFPAPMLPSLLVRSVVEGAHSPGRAPVGMGGGGAAVVTGAPEEQADVPL